ncbi:MAG: chorismate mutase [Coriobacteriia bacterium]|nr:chorismate mutase [Coriobacteriia bacterium]
MEREEALAQIQTHRDRIDELDVQIVSLLNEREGHSMAIRELKPAAGMQLFDPGREDAILEKICAQNEGPIVDEKLKEIYATLLKVMKENPKV